MRFFLTEILPAALQQQMGEVRGQRDCRRDLFVSEQLVSESDSRERLFIWAKVRNFFT